MGLREFIRHLFGTIIIDVVQRSQHKHWSPISREKVALLEKEMKGRWYHGQTVKYSGNSIPDSTRPERNTINIYSRNAENDSQGGHPGNGSSSEPSGDASSRESSQTSRWDEGDSSADGGIPGAGFALNIVEQNQMKGFVLFAVQGAKRLHSTRTRLAQIDVEIHKDDDSFFDELRIQYDKLRGLLRRIFSIWTFMTCEFVEVCGRYPPLEG